MRLPRKAGDSFEAILLLKFCRRFYCIVLADLYLANLIWQMAELGDRHSNGVLARKAHKRTFSRFPFRSQEASWEDPAEDLGLSPGKSQDFQLESSQRKPKWIENLLLTLVATSRGDWTANSTESTIQTAQETSQRNSLRTSLSLSLITERDSVFPNLKIW